MRMRRAAFVALALLVAVRVEAANHFVRRAATGSGGGADWTNACTDFTGSCAASSLVRGDIYYVANGMYSGGRTFNTPNSGTALITIRGATVADHGTTTGWLDSYAVDSSQAHFGDGLVFNSSYWVFDGTVGSGASSQAYGFIIDKPSCSGDYQSVGVGATIGIVISNLTISHVAFVACTQDIGRQAIVMYTQAGSWNDSTVSHNLFNGFQNAIVFEGQGGPDTNQIFEYNYMVNSFSSAAHHGEQVDVDGNSVANLIVRYNTFADCFGTACVAANNSPILGAAFYGNIVGNAVTGNGIFGTGSNSYMKNVLVYNNTFYSSASPWWFGGCVPGTAACGNATGNIAENNLIWNMPGTLGGGVATEDYNAYFQASSIPSEAHGQISSSNPFVNSSAGNFHLAGATSGGLALPSLYNTDPDGNIRGGDGVWDRGANEYSGRQPGPPTNLRVVP